MKKSIIVAAISFAMIAGNAYSDFIKSFDNEKDWMTYIKKNTPKEYSEIKDLSPEERREKLKTREDVEKYVIAWGSRGRFFVPLKIVDENNNTIQNITVRLTKSIGGFWTTKYKEIREENLNGFVIVEASGCKTITIDILPGKNYYPRAKECSYYIGIPPKEYYFEKGNTVIGLPIPVGFRKKGEILKLQQAGPIKFHLDKDTNKSNIFLINSWKAMDEIKNTREPYFTVDYKRDQNGKILLKEHPLISFDYAINSHGNMYKTSKISGHTPVLRFDQVEFVLVSKNPDDGMILYNTQEILPIIPIEPIAPLTGYKKSFIMPYSSDHSQYRFFFKVGGRYGKGVISYDQWGNHIIENLYINNEKDPRKKRNLWTE